MNDTTLEFAKRVRQRFLALAPAERVSLCADMFETARALVEASLPPGLDPIGHGVTGDDRAERARAELGCSPVWRRPCDPSRRQPPSWVQRVLFSWLFQP